MTNSSDFKRYVFIFNTVNVTLLYNASGHHTPYNANCISSYARCKTSVLVLHCKTSMRIVNGWKQPSQN